MRLILASRSPRRRQLLTEAGYAYDILVPSTADECGSCSRESPAEVVLRLALKKAKDVVGQLHVAGRAGTVIACDTVAEVDGQVLGKPDSLPHARRMLSLLRGRTHRVLTGLCVWPFPDRAPLTRLDVTTLRMDPITDEQLEEYLETYAWEGKAGAFGYQDGWDWLHILQGSESNVVGLPMELLKTMLDEIAIRHDA
ncbi:MAG: Maf family protein [Pirellulales bacterium]